MTAQSLASVTIDVDGLRHYHAIHGLAPPFADRDDGAGFDPLVVTGVGRFLEVCAKLGFPATLFVVGADIADDKSDAASLVRRAHREGHEIASHSYAHRYDLSRLAPAEIEADLARSIDVVTGLTGERPRGFRAPGYNVSEPLFDAIEKLGFAYDSSLMPSPFYFGARAAVLGAYRAFSRFAGERPASASASIVGTWSDFVGAPSTPFRPRRSHRSQRARSRVEARDFIEVPIAVGPLGVPYLGTTLALSSGVAGLAQTTAALLSSSGPLVLELHAIDFVDVDDGGISPALARVQRELYVPVRKKLARLETALRMIARTRDLVTVGAIASSAAA